MEHHNVKNIEVKAQFLFYQKVSFYISLTTMGTVLFTPYEKKIVRIVGTCITKFFIVYLEQYWYLDIRNSQRIRFLLQNSYKMKIQGN